MTVSLNDLDALGKTAWLTAYCHCATAADHGLDRPLSAWLIDTVGQPDFAAKIQTRTLHGVTIRAKIIDDWLDEIVGNGESAQQPYTVLSLGAGFDSRWHGRLEGGSIGRWIEIDRPPVLAAKRDLVASSPFGALHGQVEDRGGDLAENVEDLIGDLEAPAVVIAEGVLDYLPREPRERLLRALRANPNVVSVILDAQNAFLRRLANRNAEVNTGDRNTQFAWAPRDPVRYLAKLGFKTRREYRMIPELAAIAATSLERLAVRLLPQLQKGYRILLLE